MDEFDSPVETPPPARLTVAKVGWWIGGAGFMLALVAVAVLGQGATRFEAAASIAHRIALLVMLVGMLIALVGHRASWLKGRLSILRSPRVDQPVLDAQVIDVEPNRVRTAPAAEVKAILLEPMMAFAFVFCLTLVLSISEAMLLLFGALIGLSIAGVANIAVGLALALAVFFGKSYLRAFALGASVPAFCLLCLTPFLFTFASGQFMSWSRFFRHDSLVLLVMLGWLSIVPAGLVGVMVIVFLRVTTGARSNHESYE